MASVNKLSIDHRAPASLPGVAKQSGVIPQQTQRSVADSATPSLGHIAASASRGNLGFFKIRLQEKQNSPYFVALDKWASQAERGEHRNEAVKRYKEWVNRGDRERALNIADLGLRSLPDMPVGIKYFYAGGNKLTQLPSLPAGLVLLSVPNNAVTSLPDLLPASMTDLNVFGNCLTTLPNNIAELDTHHSLINLSRNPLPDNVRQHLEAVTEANQSLPILFDRSS